MECVCSGMHLHMKWLRITHPRTYPLWVWPGIPVLIYWGLTSLRLANVLGPSSLLQKQDRLLPPPITGLSGKAKPLKNDYNKNNKLVTAAIKFLAFSGACCTLQMIAVDGGELKMGHLGLLEERNLLLLLPLSSGIMRECRMGQFFFSIWQTSEHGSL